MSFLSDVWDGITGQSAADSAAAASNAASQQQIDEQRRQFNLTRGDLLPFLQAGQNSLGQLQSQAYAPAQQFSFDASQLANDPGYQFRLQQGQQQMDRISALNRNLGSGSRLIAAQQYGQGIASDELGNAFNRQLQTFGANEASRGNQFNRISTLAGLGSSSAQNIGAFGQAASNNIQSSLGAIGQSNAASSLAGYQGARSLLRDGIMAYGLGK